jgi:hypothetical protein
MRLNLHTQENRVSPKLSGQIDHLLRPIAILSHQLPQANVNTPTNGPYGASLFQRQMNDTLYSE